MYKYGCRSYCYLFHYGICITSVILCNLERSQTFFFSGHMKSKILNNVHETFAVYNSPKQSEVLSSLLCVSFSITCHKERWELRNLKQLLVHATVINLCPQTKQEIPQRTIWYSFRSQCREIICIQDRIILVLMETGCDIDTLGWLGTIIYNWSKINHYLLSNINIAFQADEYPKHADLCKLGIFHYL